MKTVEIDAPAYWAPALINRDYTGLDTTEMTSINAWVNTHGWPVSVSEDTFTGKFNGLLTLLSTYTVEEK